MPENCAKKEATVLWLVPSEPMGSAFRSTIAGLAEKYDGPLFEQHLTLGFGDAPARQDFAHQSIILPAGEICFTSQFTKNLFLRFASTHDLTGLRDSLGCGAAEEYDPHLSLFYGYLPHATQMRLAASLHFPFRTVISMKFRLSVAWFRPRHKLRLSRGKLSSRSSLGQRKPRLRGEFSVFRAALKFAARQRAQNEQQASKSCLTFDI